MNIKERLASIFDSFSTRRTTLGIDYRPKRRNTREKWETDKFKERTMLLYYQLANGSLKSRGFHAPAHHGSEFWAQVHARLQMLYGQFAISRRQVNSPLDDLAGFLRECSTDRFFDFIEQSFRVEALRYLLYEENELVDAINEVLRFGTVPYQLTRMVKRVEKDGTETDGFDGTYTVTITAYPMLIRTDEEITYQEAVWPALAVLEAPHFEAANGELRIALEKYKNNEFEECLTRCGSCFESVLKILCTRRGWNRDGERTIGPLLGEVIKESEIPSFLEQPLIGIATIRNRLSSAHGGGSKMRIATRSIAQYAITSTCAAIVLLTEEIGT